MQEVGIHLMVSTKCERISSSKSENFFAQKKFIKSTINELNGMKMIKSFKIVITIATVKLKFV